LKTVQRLRDRMAGGEGVFGTFVAELVAAGAVQILANGGLDFFMIDDEHGCYDISQIRALIQAGKDASICPFVRTPFDNRGKITKMLDAGVEGIVFPQIMSMDDVRKAVCYSKYPPVGRRGVHMFRPHTAFKRPKDLTAYLETANRTIITGMQIETVEATEIIEEIAAFDGVDMLYIGPGDLSVNLGCTGQNNDPKMLKVFELVAHACNKHGKLAGCHIVGLDNISKLIKQGFRCFGYAAASRILLEGTETLVSRFNEAKSI